MHELPVTESILDIVLRHATANKVRNVVSIKIFNMRDGEAFYIQELLHLRCVNQLHAREGLFMGKCRFAVTVRFLMVLSIMVLFVGCGGSANHRSLGSYNLCHA